MSTHFTGISVTFSCVDGEQYAAIGRFWEVMRELFPARSLEGLGFNWHNGFIEYVIGSKHGLLEELVGTSAESAKIKDIIDRLATEFPNPVFKTIQIPAGGWHHYNATTSRLDELYTEIYKDGSLDYEIEEFFDDDTCSIDIHRPDAE